MSSTPPQEHPSEAPPGGDAIDVRRVAIAGGVLVAVVIGCAVAMIGVRALFAHLYGRAPVAHDAIAPAAVAGPPLQPAPAFDLEAFRRSKLEMLHTYRWIDREKGIVQIPIEQAMRILAARSAGNVDATGARK